jgi:hypothetical protein
VSRAEERNWCWPLLHDWSKWSSGVVNKEGVLVQIRKCRRCNLEQVHIA